MRVDAPVLAAYIEANPGVMPASVAEHLDVSVRTVRTYVNQTNSAMEGFARIELSRKNGYHLEIQDMARYEAWTADAREKKQTLPQTPQARVSYLLNDLLMRTDWITLDDLREVLFVSRSTISNDLKRVQSVLESFGLALEMRPHYGIRVSGSEMARRLCLANIIMDAFNGAAETESDPGIAISTLLSDYGRRSEVGIHNPTLDTISNCVESVAVAENFQINAVAYQNLLIHIAVALVRIQEDCYVPMETERLERMKGQREYQVAEKIADAIDREMNVQLPEEEIAYIAIHLAGKRTMLGAGASEDEGLVISDGVWRVVSEMLDCVWNAFRFDFRNDLELRMNLARHIVPLAVRLRYHMNLKNPLLADIKTCDACKGSGQQVRVVRGLFGQSYEYSECPVCHGEGKIITNPCQRCGGHGVVKSKEEINFNIPAGVSDGMELRLRGAGNAAKNNGTPGDLLVLISEEAHPDFRREGNNLIYSLFISVPDAILGKTVEIPYFNEKLKVKIEPGTQPGQVLKFSGRGIPVLNGFGRGDLLVYVQVWVPKKLDKDTRLLVESLSSRPEFEPKPVKEDKNFFDKFKRIFG